MECKILTSEVRACGARIFPIKSMNKRRFQEVSSNLLDSVKKRHTVHSPVQDAELNDSKGTEIPSTRSIVGKENGIVFP